MNGWAAPIAFADVWSAAVESRPDSTFLIFEDSSGGVTNWTYAEFDHEVGRVASSLIANNVQPGSRVHVALTNHPTFIAIWLAANRLGAAIVPSDPMGRPDELADHIQRTNPSVGFCAVDRSDIYAEAAPTGLPWVTIDESNPTFDVFPSQANTKWASPRPTDIASIMFTSGTTGRPKGVQVTQANYAFAGKTMADAADLHDHDRQLVVLPLFHANAQYYSFASAIWAGSSVALIHKFSASGFLTQASRHEATCASLFAAPIRMILARGAPVEGLALRNCWFAQNIADDQYETFSSWIGCRPRQLYGMTETIPAVITDAALHTKPQSMGFVTPGCSVEVLDPAGQPTKPGEVGEIVVGGEPGITLFDGYLDDPDTTTSSFAGEWFLTGDRAWRDNDGHFYFDGRRSDVLKVAGENVSTVEIESVLSAHPAVLEASVLGAHDPVLDEVPVAFVVPVDSTQPPSKDDLDVWCEDRLAKAKRPREITILDELPRTSVGKIRKFLLKDKVSTQ